MAANALISWMALRYALGLAALRAELLGQPRCPVTSVLRRRRRLAEHFAVPLVLWGFNTAVGVTVALRQSMHSGSIGGELSALLLYSLFQVRSGIGANLEGTEFYFTSIIDMEDLRPGIFLCVSSRPPAFTRLCLFSLSNGPWVDLLVLG